MKLLKETQTTAVSYSILGHYARFLFGWARYCFADLTNRPADREAASQEYICHYWVSIVVKIYGEFTGSMIKYIQWIKNFGHENGYN